MFTFVDWPFLCFFLSLSVLLQRSLLLRRSWDRWRVRTSLNGGSVIADTGKRPRQSYFSHERIRRKHGGNIKIQRPERQCRWPNIVTFPFYSICKDSIWHFQLYIISPDCMIILTREWLVIIINFYASHNTIHFIDHAFWDWASDWPAWRKFRLVVAFRLAKVSKKTPWKRRWMLLKMAAVRKIRKTVRNSQWSALKVSWSRDTACTKHYCC